MQLHVHANARAFLDYNQAFLEEKEVTNGLLLGLTLHLAKNALTDQQALFFSVRRDERPIFACMQTSFRHFIFSPSEADAWQLVLDYLIKNNIPIPKLVGPRQLVSKVAEYWTKQTGGQTNWNMRQLIYRLDQIIPVAEKEGLLRLAQRSDQTLLQAWIKAFSKESLGELMTPEAAAQLAATKIKAGHLFVWENKEGKVVTMSAIARPTANGISINYVYTPPVYRKQGWASICVAALSQLMLDRGFSFCTLFTDEDFPTSNRIYKKMGYYEVTTFASIQFEK